MADKKAGNESSPGSFDGHTGIPGVNKNVLDAQQEFERKNRSLTQSRRPPESVSSPYNSSGYRPDYISSAQKKEQDKETNLNHGRDNGDHHNIMAHTMESPDGQHSGHGPSFHEKKDNSHDQNHEQFRTGPGFLGVNRNVLDAQKMFEAKSRGLGGKGNYGSPSFSSGSAPGHSTIDGNNPWQPKENTSGKTDKNTDISHLENSSRNTGFRQHLPDDTGHANYAWEQESTHFQKGHARETKFEQAANRFTGGPKAWKKKVALDGNRIVPASAFSIYSMQQQENEAEVAADGENAALNEIITDGKLDMQKFRSHGTKMFRFSDLEKLSVKSTIRYLIDITTYGTDARKGGELTYDTLVTSSVVIADNARIQLAHSLEKNLTRNINRYNDFLEKAGGKSMRARYGIDWSITKKKDLLQLQQGINAYLKKEYGTVIRGTGKVGLYNAMRFLRDNKNLPEELRELIKTVYRDGMHAQVLLGRNKRLRGFSMAGRRWIGRYLRQTDGGYGLYLAYQIALRSKATLRAALYLIRSVGKTARIAALQGAKAAAWAAGKAAKHLPDSIKQGKGFQTTKKTADTVKTGAERLSKGYSRHRDRFQRFRHDPFGVRAWRKRATQNLKRNITERLNRTFLKKPIRVAGKVLRIPNAVGSVIARAVSVVMTTVYTISSFLVIGLSVVVGIVLLIILIMAAIMAIISAFDFTAHEETIIDAAINQIEESYEEQNQEIASLSSRYRNVTVTYQDVKDADVYALEENQPSYPINQTTNAAELLCMATVYYDFDLESAGEDEVRDYIRRLYNGSHTTSIVTHVYTYTDENGEPYNVTDADVTLTTYYFNELFNCSLQDNFGVLSGTETSQQVWNYFRSAGFSEESTAAIMGNLMRESGLDPTRIQGNGAGPAAGIAQWENYNLGTGRWLTMSEYANSQGKEWTDLECQLDFIIIEMPQVFSTYTGHGTYTYDNGTVTWWPDPVTVEEFKAMTDIDTATEIFERTFTRASVPAMQERINYAHSFYEMYKGTEASSTTAQAIVDTAYAQLGKPYVYGATGPDSFDCSGLVQYCYQAAGISIPRTAEEQAAQGTTVYTPEPGDICCTSGHVGIYIGNNQMIEAQQDGVPVCISTVRADKFVRFE